MDGPKIDVSSIFQPLSVMQIPPIPGGALGNTLGLQSPTTSMAAQSSGLALKSQVSASSTPEAPSSTIAHNPASASLISTSGTGHRPCRIVTLHVHSANVPAHLKAMSSQGNPNGPAFAPTPAPAATAAASRAPSAAPTPSAMPAEAAEHGSATRVYINTKVTYHLLAGMKELAKHKYVYVSVSGERYAIGAEVYRRENVQRLKGDVN